MTRAADIEPDERPVLEADADLTQPLPAHNSLSLVGWAAASHGVESVKVLAAGREFTASYGLPAPDVAAARPDLPGVEHSRFQLILDTSGWSPGEHPFEIVATDRAGAERSISGVARIQPFEQPTPDQQGLIEAIAEGRDAMWCDAPNLWGGGFVTEKYPEVSGWAVSPYGIDRVLITIDGVRQLRAVHNLARPDLRWCFGDEVAADCGFVLRFDPGELPPGRHELAVVAVTGAGKGIGVAGMIERREAAVPAAAGTEPLENDLGHEDERFVPSLHRGTPMETEHRVRYSWAASLAEDRDVLDAGCGLGWGTALLAERARGATGLDLSPVSIEEAEREYGGLANFREGDLLDIPFGDDSFDLVVCFEAIEHIEDPDRVLDEMRRVLRPDGLLLASSPNRGVYPEGNPFHLSERTSAEFQRALEARFGEVGVYRQQTYVSTLLGTDDDLHLSDPAESLDSHVSKVFGDPPGSELYTVAAASDGELPPPPHRVVLGGQLDHTADRRMIQVWQERAIKAEVEAAAIRTTTFYETRMQRRTIGRATARLEEQSERVARLERELQASSERLEEEISASKAMRRSVSWRLTAPLRAIKRSLQGEKRRPESPTRAASG